MPVKPPPLMTHNPNPGMLYFEHAGERFWTRDGRHFYLARDGSRANGPTADALTQQMQARAEAIANSQTRSEAARSKQRPAKNQVKKNKR